MERATVIGVVGCGVISAVYCEELKKFSSLKLKSCADLIPAAAERRASEFGIAAVPVDRLLADDEIDIVVNLTQPAAHYELNQRILKAGKHLYSEKPMTLSLADASRLLELADSAGRRIGSSPDTFMGGAHQTALGLVRNGAMGNVTSATAYTMFAGPEKFHPSPEFFYQTGAGPVLDMFPYHITHLVSFLGPVAEVRAVGASTWPVRQIKVGPNAGRQFKSDVPTHYIGIVTFRSGALATLIASFDGWKHSHPHLELYGTEGTLTAPNPDYFGGDVRVARMGEDFCSQPLTAGFADGNYRGIGVADLAAAIRAGRPHRADGRLAFHVLETMLAFDRSAELGQPVAIASACEAPAPLARTEDFGYVPASAQKAAS